MNRNLLESELKTIGVTMTGWDLVLRCDKCGKTWEPFQDVEPGVTMRMDYWRCPRGCNGRAMLNQQLKTVIPRRVVINDVAGFIFSDEDLADFREYVNSMETTQVWNKES